MSRLLIIDDDPIITEPLARRLGTRGFNVSVANNGRDGLEMALKNEPHLVILDVMMPEMDGWEVCRRLREKSTVPILMLTALDDEFDRITGLELGADDYLAKPFSTNELVARLNAMLRRVKMDQQTAETQDVLTVGEVSLNLALRKVQNGSQSHMLRQKEIELLSLLMSRAGVPVTRAQIFDEVWGTDWLGDTRTLDVHIRWLREKLEKKPSQPQLICTCLLYTSDAADD